MKKIISLSLILLILSSFAVNASKIDLSDLAKTALINYYNAYISMDANKIAETSIDELYETQEQYINSLTDLFKYDGAKIESYEILSQEKNGDGYVFSVSQLYKDGVLVECYRYVEKINDAWTVYLSKETDLRKGKIVQVSEEKREQYENALEKVNKEIELFKKQNTNAKLSLNNNETTAIMVQTQFANWGFYPILNGQARNATISAAITGYVSAIYINYRQWVTASGLPYIVYRIWNDRGSSWTPAGWVIAEESSSTVTYNKQATLGLNDFVVAKVDVSCGLYSNSPNMNTYGEAYAIR